MNPTQTRRRPVSSKLAALLTWLPLSITAIFMLPWLLLHSRQGSELAIDATGLMFLLRSVRAGDWSWLHRFWVQVGLIWWAWQVVCTACNASMDQIMALPQAIFVVRFLVFVAALEHWVLAGRRARQWLFVSLGLATLYLVGQTLLQFVTGRNLFGTPRFGDGELTGPFPGPRAGPTYVRMLFPVLVPAGYALVSGVGWLRRVGGVLLFACAVGVMVLIGQRMPVLLTLFGLVVMALLLPRLRAAVAIAIAAGGLLLAATVVISPATFYRLVTKFSRQMADFPDSPYGQIAGRSIEIAEQHPLLGRGYEGFRSGCPMPRYFADWHWPGTPSVGDGGGAAICVTHPHSFYLQALTDAGVPGLVLFCLLVGAWLFLLGRGLLRRPDPVRVGLFVAVLLQVWPIASTSPLISMPIGGWCFLLLGFGLAESRAAKAVTAPAPVSEPLSAAPA